MDQYQLAVRGNNEGLWDWNLASSRVHFSPRWMALVGCHGDDVGNTPDVWLERIHPDDLSEVRQAIDAHLAGGAGEFDIPHRLRHKDGTYRYMSCRGVVVRDNSGRAVRLLGTHSDVTAEKTSDALTGLPNRLLLIDHLTRSIERARRNPAHHFALLLVDLDRPGHDGEWPDGAAGDPLLSAAARRLETSLRSGDTQAGFSRNHVVARLRGDEFAILLDGLEDVGRARVVADHVLAEILAPFSLGGHEVFLSASIGIALSATGYARADEVLRDADVARCRARLLGRARCEVFDVAVLRSAEAENQLEAGFTEALDRGQFLLHYQPVVCLTSHHIVGFEALVRWQHPVHGLIPPLEFIPIAERSGFIVPLGSWILREACLQLRAWQESLPVAKNLWVSVNLSSQQFRQSALVSQVTDALRDVDLPAHCLVLELTESVAMENPTAVKGLLMQLRVLGARIGLDDFGTGQSSLAYLHQFPADILKVDRSFVRSITTQKDATDIVGAVTGLAHQLGLSVIVEGIETEEQLTLVRSLQCEYGQGFFFSRPVDSERAANLLKTGLPPRPGTRRGGDRAPEAQAEERSVQPSRARGPFGLAKSLYVAAAVLAVLVCAGLVARLAYDATPPARPALQPAPASAPAMPRHTDPVATPPPDPPFTTPQAPTRSRPAASTVPTESRRPLPSTAIVSAPLVESLAPRAAGPVPDAPTPMQYSLGVEHRHGLGGCRGTLTLSQSGVTYTPDKAQDAPDGFVLKYNDFLYALSDDTLTIKSHAKTYRIKATGATGKEDSRARLKKVIENLERLRRGTPPI